MAGVPWLTLLAVGNGDEEVIVHNQRQKSNNYYAFIFCLCLFVSCGNVWRLATSDDVRRLFSSRWIQRRNLYPVW